ncbi:MAG: thioredoxin family protein [Candidatus Hodarchaeales archaeon]|jgi:peroxiredoxin
MVSVESQMLPLGTKAPDFTLPNTVDNQDISLNKARGKNATLVFFISNHCPYVIHVRDHFKNVYDEYSSRGVSFIAISANDVDSYPVDAPEHMKELAVEKGWQFAYCYDETQQVAKSYKAACTPDFFLFDGDLKLYYRGQFDTSRPKNDEPVTGKDLKNAIDLLLAGKKYPEVQIPSIGCNIKWKTGNEPEYFG